MTPPAARKRFRRCRLCGKRVSTARGLCALCRAHVPAVAIADGGDIDIQGLGRIDAASALELGVSLIAQTWRTRRTRLSLPADTDSPPGVIDAAVHPSEG
jgi:hypothetical protein